MEAPLGRADLKHCLRRPRHEARLPQIAAVRVPIAKYQADGAGATRRLQVPREQNKHATKVSWPLHQHVMNPAGSVVCADFEDQIAHESLMAHEFCDSEAKVGMPDVSPAQRLLTHVAQDQVPLGEVAPERIEGPIDVIGKLE